MEVTPGWEVESDGFSRKLSSVRFLSEPYQRHLDWLLALEEIDGYLEAISRLNNEGPHSPLQYRVG